MPKSKQLSRRKGATFERLIANHFQKYWPDAKRGLLQTRAANEVSDVENTPFWCEAKHKITVSVPAALRQAFEATDGRMVIVVWRKNQGSIRVSIPLDDLHRILIGTVNPPVFPTGYRFMSDRESPLYTTMSLDTFFSLLIKAEIVPAPGAPEKGAPKSEKD